MFISTLYKRNKWCQEKIFTHLFKHFYRDRKPKETKCLLQVMVIMCMKQHHLRPFGVFLGYLMHLYTILNIKVAYFITRQDTTRNHKHYRSYSIIIKKLYKCSENQNSSWQLILNTCLVNLKVLIKFKILFCKIIEYKLGHHIH